MNTWVSIPDTMAASITGLVIAFGISQDVQVEPPPPSIFDFAFRYRSENVAVPIAIMPIAQTGDSVVDRYQPRTALGRRLLALRRAHVLSGGRLLGWDEIDAEVRSRRGGRGDA